MVSELEPNNAMALMNYGGMLVELKEYEKADEVFTKAIHLKPMIILAGLCDSMSVGWLVTLTVQSMTDAWPEN